MNTVSVHSCMLSTKFVTNSTIVIPTFAESLVLADLSFYFQDVEEQIGVDKSD